MNIADYRREYTQSGLNRADLDTDPLKQFERWFQQAVDSDYPDANAMSLSTVSAEGKPSSRTVLLKGLDSEGFTFFTNYDSAKGKDMLANAHVALLFPWLQFERQVRVCGTVNKISKEATNAYFQSRPIGSQLSAWASNQSQQIDSRETLDQQFDAMSDRFKDSQPDTPDFWGGYKVIPQSIEFWQGRHSRLHDRFVYQLTESGHWNISRLQP